MVVTKASSAILGIIGGSYILSLAINAMRQHKSLKDIAADHKWPQWKVYGFILLTSILIINFLKPSGWSQNSEIGALAITDRFFILTLWVAAGAWFRQMWINGLRLKTIAIKISIWFCALIGIGVIGIFVLTSANGTDEDLVLINILGTIITSYLLYKEFVNTNTETDKSKSNISMHSQSSPSEQNNSLSLWDKCKAILGGIIGSTITNMNNASQSKDNSEQNATIKKDIDELEKDNAKIERDYDNLKAELEKIDTEIEKANTTEESSGGIVSNLIGSTSNDDNDDVDED